MKPFQPTTVNPNMMKYAEHIAFCAVSAAIALGIVLAVDGQTGRTADALHQMQAARIDSLEAKVARLSEKLIDGAIIVIDCHERNTGRMTK